MQTVRTFRKLRGGGQGREGKGTVLHMKLIDARRPGAEGPDGGKRQWAGFTFSPRTRSGELLRAGRLAPGRAR